MTRTLTLINEGILRFFEGHCYLETASGLLPVPITEVVSLEEESISVSLAGQRARWVLYVFDVPEENKE